MFLENTDLELFLEKIASYDGHDFDKFILFFSNEQINTCLIQHLSRIIDGEKIDFLSLRSIEVNKAHRHQQIFKRIIQAMEKTRLPIFVDDIVNEIVDDFLDNRGYVSLVYKKQESDYCFRNARYRLY